VTDLVIAAVVIPEDGRPDNPPSAPDLCNGRAQERWPAARSVLTWNASENRHMLALNTSLGFKPSGFEGEWQKRLDDPLYGT
jgi:hypothetical protein